MSKPRKTQATTSPDAAPPSYSEELPATPEERKRRSSGFARNVREKRKGPDPRVSATPYDGGNFNGTNDSSRFSTPPARKP